MMKSLLCPICDCALVYTYPAYFRCNNLSCNKFNISSTKDIGFWLIDRDNRITDFILPFKGGKCITNYNFDARIYDIYNVDNDNDIAKLEFEDMNVDTYYDKLKALYEKYSKILLLV